MSKKNDISYAIQKTLEVHPKGDSRYDAYASLETVLLHNIKSFCPNNFTSKYGARASIEKCNSDDILEFIIEGVIDVYNTGKELQKKSTNPNDDFYYIEEANQIINKIASNRVNSFIFFKTNPDYLLRAIDLVSKYKYKSGLQFRIDLDLYGGIDHPIRLTSTEKIRERLQLDRQKQSGLEKVEVNPYALNKCVMDIRNGSQLTNIRNEYSLSGNLFATQDRGRRGNQEDSVLIVEHPHNKEFKMMAIADGMGGYGDGEKASTFIVKEMLKWFDKLDPSYFQKENELVYLFNKEILEINKRLVEYKKEQNLDINCGATFVGSIIGNSKTIISSVGDSRAYALRGRRLDLITRDESKCWDPYNLHQRRPSEEELDDLRFRRDNNVIFRHMGNSELNDVQSYIAPNEYYDKLLLFSDGVTDLLSHGRITAISSRAPIDQISQMLVDEAVSYDAIREKGEDYLHKSMVSAGKDNASAIVYNRR